MENKTYQIAQSLSFEKGMIFQEMFTFWLAILDINDDDIIITLQGNTISNMKLVKYSRQELSDFIKYKSIEGCWVDYKETNIDLVNKWLKSKLENGDIEDIRDLKISLLT
jgi:hypothetical protein